MRGCADEEKCADPLMTNDLMTNELRSCQDEKAAAPCDSLPWEGREGYSQPGTTYEERPDTEPPTPQDIQPPPMTNDVMTNDKKVMTNDQKLIPKPYWGMKTSVIDMALTPELLEHILQTTTRENSIRGKGSDNFSQLNTLINTK